MHPGRNDPCPCGSGKKYKKCCGLKEQADQKSKAMRRGSLFPTALSGASGDLTKKLFKVLKATGPATGETKEDENKENIATAQALVSMTKTLSDAVQEAKNTTVSNGQEK